PGGFLPHGLRGLWMAVIVGVFSFNGVEVIAVTSGEAQNPQVAIPAALRSMVFRLFSFYILALTIIVSVIPWTATGVSVVAQSPSEAWFYHSGSRRVSALMTLSLVTSLLSSMNCVVCVRSWMLFALAWVRHAPPFPARPSRNGTPVTALQPADNTSNPQSLT